MEKWVDELLKVIEVLKEKSSNLNIHSQFTETFNLCSNSTNLSVDNKGLLYWENVIVGYVMLDILNEKHNRTCIIDFIDSDIANDTEESTSSVVARMVIKNER